MDSLLIALDQHLEEDTTKVKLLMEVAKQYFIADQETKTLLFLEDAIGLSENIGNDEFSVSIKKSAAQLYSKTGNGDKAVKELDKLLIYFETKQDSENLAQTYSYLAAMHDLQGNHPAALENYFEALTINEKETRL